MEFNDRITMSNRNDKCSLPANLVQIDARDLGDPESHGLIFRADVILGVRRDGIEPDHEYSQILFGKELVEDVAKNRASEFDKLEVLHIAFDPDTDEAQEVIETVQMLRGHCFKNSKKLRFGKS